MVHEVWSESSACTKCARMCGWRPVCIRRIFVNEHVHFAARSMPSKGGKKKGGAAAAASAAAPAGAAAGGKGKPTSVKVSERTCTGQLTSRPLSKDLKFEQFSLSYYGEDLIKASPSSSFLLVFSPRVLCFFLFGPELTNRQDTTLELTFGRRYGLIGRNGSGKSTFLKALAARDVAIPDHIDVHLLNEEAEPSELTALEVRL